MSCACKPVIGCFNHYCKRYLDCMAAAEKDAPKPDTEALFKKFVDEFPVLSALDVFCNPCGRPRAISYHKQDDGSHFYVVFSCNCPSPVAVWCHSESRPLTRVRVVEILRGE